MEWWLHGEDMRATNGLGPQWQHWPIYLTIDMAVRMLPWSLGRAGYDLSGLSVEVVVDGAGEGRWHWGLGSGEVPAGKKKPDAQLIGRAPQLALVAGQRLKPDDALLSGNVVLGGERDLAETHPAALARLSLDRAGLTSWPKPNTSPGGLRFPSLGQHCAELDCCRSGCTSSGRHCDPGRVRRAAGAASEGSAGTQDGPASHPRQTETGLTRPTRTIPNPAQGSFVVLGSSVRSHDDREFLSTTRR